MSNADGGMSITSREDADTAMRSSKVISSFCADKPQCCVEVEAFADGVRVSDSKSPENVGLIYTRAEWDAFVDGVKSDDFDYDVLVATARLANA